MGSSNQFTSSWILSEEIFEVIKKKNITTINQLVLKRKCNFNLNPNCLLKMSENARSVAVRGSSRPLSLSAG